MKFALIVYDDITLLDFCGVYDPVSRIKTMGFLPDMAYHVCALKSPVRSFEGLNVLPDQVGGSLCGYDYIFVPGGNGIGKLIGDASFLSWLRDVSPGTVMTAVCGGALALGAAGYLKDKPATTHPALMQYLSKFTDQVSTERIMDAGNVVTARGVTSAIDLGLHLAARIAGSEATEKIRAQMDYSRDTQI